jgi:hypothetical protein
MDNSYPNTEWAGDNRGLYLRKMVNIPVLETGDKLQFSMFYDEDYEFYINGVLAHSGVGYVTNYVNLDISSAAANAITYGGNNLFAIHVIQNNGGSYMDLGVTTAKRSKPIDYEEVDQPPVWKEIATAEDWMNIKNDLVGFYRLTADINLYDAVAYVPIGNANVPFRGYIDGQNHTVTCPEIKGVSDRVGLFGYADGAHFVNLRFTEALIEASDRADVGVLLGRGKGITVEHVVFDEEVEVCEVNGRDHTGIVAGMLESGASSTIKNVYVVNGMVNSERQAGGLVGIICDTRIINSYFTGTVSITGDDRLNQEDTDAAGIVSRVEGGFNYLTGVMSLAETIESASGNEFVSYHDTGRGGYIQIDSATCFIRNDMLLDPLKNANRQGQFARAAASMKRPLADFRNRSLYEAAGWDLTTVWGIPKSGGFPIFRYLGTDFVSIPVVKKENDLKVYSTGGQVVMTASQPTAVWVYDLQGSLVERTEVSGTQTIALPAGIYIVKSAQNGNVKATKVLNQ